ncbi:hypothetical protein OV090_18300 [Nannocystis sp. RBIL2]|uniref:hypothetical protein n=1 Tax=Nannocystis sp. RBIL2 TaxID=2996788 RepID=UPI002271B894|nr:hypothetical protein [Nannocystis sp. RBIL2]MCY1066732.1 hypothetical protein [Nannocystis sp. RBIL2]
MLAGVLLSLVLLLFACAAKLPSGISQLPVTISVPQVTCPAVTDGAVHGTVVLSVQVGLGGRVELVHIDHDIGGGCGEIAAAALREGAFLPAIATDGRPVAHTIRYEYEFVGVQ